MATSATVGSVSFLTVPSILSWIAWVAPSATNLWHATWLLTKLLLTHYVSNELLKAGGALFCGFKFQIILRLPEVHFEGLRSVSKTVGRIEHLDTFLG